jgi:hypothetical protein
VNYSGDLAIVKQNPLPRTDPIDDLGLLTRDLRD